LVLFSILLSSVMAFCAPLKIMPLGDSLTAGGYNLEKKWYVGGGYREPLWNSLKSLGMEVQFVGSLKHGNFESPQHEGHSGWRIEQVHAITKQAIEEYQPDVILLILGSNDLIQKFHVKTAPARFLEMVKKILIWKPDIKLFAASPVITNNSSINQRINEYSVRIKSGVRDLQSDHPDLIWVDMLEKSKLTKDDLTDGVHPTALGYQKMSDVWLEALMESRAVRVPTF